jgi:peptidyl-prolyl cis-trans isomerase SurA
MMTSIAAFAFCPCRFILGAALAIAATLAPIGGAEAQLVAVIVNGDPITNYDIEQRSKLIQASTHKAPARKDVIEELIDEKLKVQLLKRFQIESIEKDVESSFINMARRMRTTPKEFTEQLNKQGLQPDSIKARIRAELVWGQIIRGRYQSSFQFSDKDVQARLASKRPEDASSVGYDYTLRPILFVVPRGSPQAVLEERRKEAEALRTRFQSCEQGLPLARGMPHVAVRQPVVKSSADLAPALRTVLEKTEVGKLTSPELTLQGIEVFALCGKRQSDADNVPANKEMREEMYKEQFESLSRAYLKELRGQAMIEYR